MKCSRTFILCGVIFCSIFAVSSAFQPTFRTSPVLHLGRFTNIFPTKRTTPFLSTITNTNMASQVVQERPPPLEDTPKSKRATVEMVVPKTLSEALRVFFFSKDGLGPMLISATLLLLCYYRITAVGPLTPLDGWTAVTTTIFWVFQEHVLHDKVLHSSWNWMGKDIHQGHHDKPYFHISIDPPALMITWMIAAHLLLKAILPWPLALTATVAYATAGLYYEWSHYIVHTKVPPPNRLARQMRDNHMRHHCVDHRYWLAFSLPLVDDWMGTNPDVRDVQQEHRAARTKTKTKTGQNKKGSRIGTLRKKGRGEESSS